MTALKITSKDKVGAREIEIRSEAFRDILGQVPRWIVRYGTLLIVGVVFLLLLGAIYLKYPDIISARVKLTTETPPAELTANVSGRIQHVLVSDKSQVKTEQVLVIIESAVNYTDVNTVQKQLGKSFELDSLLPANFPTDHKLGIVQQSYATFVKQLQELSDYVKLDYHTRKINSIQAELKKYNLFLNSLEDQEKVLAQEYKLVLKQYARDSLLFEQEVLSSMQLEKSESLKLNKLFAWNDTKTQLASAQIEITNLQQEILELELNLEESSKQYIQQLREAYERLKGQISMWEQKYVIRSPFDGQITFTKIWSENQYIEEGNIVVTVIPSNQGDILGIITLPSMGVGKVKRGHRVLIQFDNYPYMEYGTVSGTVSSLSLVPTNEQYMAEIRLDSLRIVTNYNIELEFQQNMPGKAEVITDDRNLLSRILAPFRSAVQKQRSLK